MANPTPPIVPITYPSNIAGLVNGQLPTSVMTVVGFPKIGNAYLHSTAARCWNMMAAMFTAENPGYQLTVTSLGDAFRSYSIQYNVFFQRYTPTWSLITNGLTNRTQNTRTFNGTKYYLRKGNAAVAVPGTSNHGWGLALDVQYVDPKNVLHPLYGYNVAWAWMLLNAVRYGFSWETSETWHIRLYGGDTIPPWVLQLEQFFGSLPK